jgi:hypothetical protein
VLSISTAVAVRMLADAGIDEKEIPDLFKTFKPSASYEGAAYWNPVDISHAIKCRLMARPPFDGSTAV